MHRDLFGIYLWFTGQLLRSINYGLEVNFLGQSVAYSSIFWDLSKAYRTICMWLTGQFLGVYLWLADQFLPPIYGVKAILWGLFDQKKPEKN